MLSDEDRERINSAARAVRRCVSVSANEEASNSESAFSDFSLRVKQQYRSPPKKEEPGESTQWPADVEKEASSATEEATKAPASDELFCTTDQQQPLAARSDDGALRASLDGSVETTCGAGSHLRYDEPAESHREANEGDVEPRVQRPTERRRRERQRQKRFRLLTGKRQGKVSPHGMADLDEQADLVELRPSRGDDSAPCTSVEPSSGGCFWGSEPLWAAPSAKACWAALQRDSCLKPQPEIILVAVGVFAVGLLFWAEACCSGPT